MLPADIKDYIERYEQRLARHGNSPKSLGWSDDERRALRFLILSRPILAAPASSVLDVGCGFGDFYDFLKQKGWNGTYTGVDLVPGLLDIASASHPGINFVQGDIQTLDFPPRAFDFVVASGVFNAKLRHEENTLHIVESMRKMFSLTRLTMAIDFLGPDVEYVDPLLWYTDPCWALSTARALSRRVVLRADYMPFEYALFLHAGNTLGKPGCYEESVSWP